MNDEDFDNDFGSEYTPPIPDRPTRKLPFKINDVDYLRPPGFAGDLTDWINSQCRFPRENLAVASALVSLGNICGLRFEDSRDGVTANLLAFCVAASSTGKEAVMQAMSDIMHAAGVHYALQGGIKSEQEIMRNLIEHQAAYYIVDEIGIFLSKVRNAQRRGGAAYLEGVFGAIMSAYSKANSRLWLNGDSKRELRKIFVQALSRANENGDPAEIDRAERMCKMIDDGLPRPFLSLMGFTTPSTFDGIMDGETATQGFVGRAIIISERDINPRVKKGFSKPDMTSGMVSRLSGLYGGGEFSVIGTPRVEYAGERTDIPTTKEADNMLDDVADWLHNYADEMGENTGEASVAMIRRAYEMIAKISFILAIPEGTRNEEHVKWSFAFVLREIDAKIKLVYANDNEKEKPQEALAAKILNILSTETGATISVIANRTRKKQPEIEKIMAKLEAANEVVQRAEGRVYNGKKTAKWYLFG